MQFKLFFAFAVFAYASAAFLGGKVISVSNDGSNVQVASQNGVRVQINRNQFGATTGLGEVDITVVGPQGNTRTVQVNDRQGARIVSSILAQHQGVVDELTFENIVNKVENLVQVGQVSPAFARVLRLLENDSLTQVALGSNQQLRKQLLIEDILEKENQIEALTQTQQQAQVAKNILKQRLAQEQSQGIYGLNQPDILNKEAKIEALTATQQQAEIIKENLEQQVAQEQNELAQTTYGQQVFGRQGIFNTFGARQGFLNTFGSRQGLNQQVGIQREAVVKDILRKEAKVQALTQVQQEVEMIKNVLENTIMQEQTQGSNLFTAQDVLRKAAKIEALTEAQEKAQIKKQVLRQEIAQDQLRLNGQQGIQTVFGIEKQLTNQIFAHRNPVKQAEIEKEALLESILKKEAKIQALTEIQQETQITKEVLKKQAVQEQIFGQGRLGFTNTQEELLRKEAKLEALTEVQQKAQATKNILRQQVVQEEQQLNQIAAVEAGILSQNSFGVRGAAFPLVYQRPSVWNQVMYRTQTPYTFGGRFNTLSGITGLGQQNLAPLAQQQLIQQQVERQFDREVQREQAIQKQLQQELIAERIQNQAFAY